MIGFVWYQATITPKQVVPREHQLAVLQLIAHTLTDIGSQVETITEQEITFRHGLWEPWRRKGFQHRSRVFNSVTTGWVEWTKNGDLVYQLTFTNLLILSLLMGCIAGILFSTTMGIIFIGILAPLNVLANGWLSIRWFRHVITNSIETVLADDNTPTVTEPPPRMNVGAGQ